MNIKYKDLSIIGKGWSLAELLKAGIRDKKDAYLVSTFKKIRELQDNKELKNSHAVKETTFDNIMIHATNILHQSKYPDTYIEFDNDGSIASTIWFLKTELDSIKERIKNNRINSEDLPMLNEIYSTIRKFWVTDLKNKELTSQERSDLFKIKKEVETLLLNVEKRAERNQINVL